MPDFMNTLAFGLGMTALLGGGATLYSLFSARTFMDEQKKYAEEVRRRGNVTEIIGLEEAERSGDLYKKDEDKEKEE